MSEIEKLKTKAKLLQKAKKRAGISLRLKDAFELLAKKAGFSSWRDLKATLDENPDFFPKGASAFWHVWYASYDEAKAHLQEQGGYLLPYRKQFFICDESYLAYLGLSTADADLLKVGSNWVEPRDGAAWRRLVAKLKK